VSASEVRRASSRRSNSSADFEIDPARYTPEFSWRGNELYCEGVGLEEIAARVGTPAYVYSSASISAAYRNLDRALGRQPHTLCYAVKANSNLSILRLLARLGSGFDIVSAGELFRLQRAGVDSECIVFSGAGKSRDEIREKFRRAAELLGHDQPGPSEPGDLAVELARHPVVFRHRFAHQRGRAFVAQEIARAFLELALLVAQSEIHFVSVPSNPNRRLSATWAS
jgi:hypothetical protein